MVAPGDFPLPQLESNDMESFPANQNSVFWNTLGAEIVFAQNKSGQYLSFHWKAAQEYGIDCQEIVGSSLEETICPVNVKAYQKIIQHVLEKGIPQKCSCFFKYGDKLFPWQLVITPVLVASGDNEFVLVTGHLLPQNSNPELHKSGLLTTPDPYQELLKEIARNIRRTLKLKVIWQKTVSELGAALNVSRCLILSYQEVSRDKNKSKLKVEAEYLQGQIPSQLSLETQLKAEPYIQKALSSGVPLAIDSLDLTEKLDGCGVGAKSILVATTSYRNQPNSVIYLQQCDRLRQWNNAEIELVKELADQVGTAIAHATLYGELEEARNQAEEASRLKSEFLANTSHELRTPLNGIIGFLKLIIEGMADTPEEQEEFIEEAHKSALHLLNLINDVLDIAKIEAGKMELELTTVPLNELIHDVDSFTNSQAHHKNLSYTNKIPATRDPDGIILYGNYQRLKQVLLNLVGNAIKFTQEGGVTISAEVVKKKMVVNGEECPGLVMVRVADTGIGVALDKQERLFQSFSQVDGSRTRTYGGTGLGLAISQKLIEAMGGVVNFYSMGEGLGSTVTFTVPLYKIPILSE